MHILSGKSKCIGGSTSREREVACEMSLIDYYNINWKSAFAQMESERKRFGFLKG